MSRKLINLADNLIIVASIVLLIILLATWGSGREPDPPTAEPFAQFGF